jgi:hypothetical protein
MKKFLLTTALATVLLAPAAHAMTWTNWTSGTVGYPGSASGMLGSIAVTYSGEMQCLNCYASDWSPASTWAFVPPPDNSGIRLIGGNGGHAIINTITFSSPVVNPVMAIVSLGQGGIKAEFDFLPSEPFSLAGGGPSIAWGGQALTSIGSTVFGIEGNGLVVFHGTYTSISWTNPVAENYYVATIGAPEASTWAMMLGGFGALGLAGYRRAARQRLAA